MKKKSKVMNYLEGFHIFNIKIVSTFLVNLSPELIFLVFSDDGIEAYDVLVALLESELGQILASCRAAGFGNPNMSQDESDQVESLLERAFENRIVTDAVAHRLLLRFGNKNEAQEGVGNDRLS